MLNINIVTNGKKVVRTIKTSFADVTALMVMIAGNILFWQKEKSWFYKKIEKSLKRKRKIRWFDCACGEKFSVTTNVYDNSDSGVGHCECWKCSVTIN